VIGVFFGHILKIESCFFAGKFTVNISIVQTVDTKDMLEAIKGLSDVMDIWPLPYTLALSRPKVVFCGV